ncbi:MAG: hypothetical protein JO061_03990 [Acidobacteriaceae bacterium]|nr:hypothetical protein [Acidobacteriaceae bacterium]
MPLAPSTVLNSYDWIERFYQRACRPEVSWGAAKRLPYAERSAAARSLQEFARNENGSGEWVVDWAREIAARNGDRGFIWAFRLFLRDECRQGWLVNRLLDQLGMPHSRGSWVDFVLRMIGKLRMPSLYLHVLAGVEVVSRSYYRALGDATESDVIRQICKRLAEEQDAHVEFTAFAIPLMHPSRTRLAQSSIQAAHRAFVFAALLRVWLRHSPVFHKSGRTFRGVWKETMSALDTTAR